MPIHPSVDGLLSCLYLLAIANNAAVNTGIQKSFRASVFSSFRYIPRSGIAGSYGNSVFKLVVLAALGLCCSAQAFSSCGVRGLLSSCGGRVSHCGGFSCCRAQALGCMDFSSYGAQA